jgi:RNA-directed DNA polymerase
LFGFNKSVSTALTTLTTLDSKLPQGAPTSPMISNLVFRNMDYRINEFSKKINVEYSRYADDLTFSSKKKFDKVYVLLKISNILESNGYKLNKNKTRMFSNHMIVNGLVIKDKKLNVQNSYIRNIEQDFYYIDKYGLEDHLKHKFDYKKDPSIYLEEMFGKINYIKQINSKIGLDLLDKFNKIVYSHLKKSNKFL